MKPSATPASTDWLNDLISPEGSKRQEAVRRHAKLVRDAQAAMQSVNEIWRAAGENWQPTDPGLAARMDQAQAAFRNTTAQQLPVLAAAWLQGHRPPDGAGDVRFPLLYLQWETLYPQDWWAAHTWSPWHLKKHLLKDFTKTAGLQPPHVQHALRDLVLEAIQRQHRCEDQGYGPLAQALADPELRSRLTQHAEHGTQLTRLRAQFVASILDNPQESPRPATWNAWLARGRSDG